MKDSFVQKCNQIERRKDAKKVRHFWPFYTSLGPRKGRRGKTPTACHAYLTGYFQLFLPNNVSFFLSIIAAFGLGSMVYNGMELGSFFEIPWNSPCYQVLRGINPILQMIFTFSQLYFVFMNARVRRLFGSFFVSSVVTG